MRELTPPFQFDASALVGKATRHVKKRVDGVSINLPFVSISFKPDDSEQRVAREVVIRLADKRVLNAFECCDSCIEQALSSLQEIRAILVDKEVELSERTDGGLYLILELMLTGIRQFFTFEEGLRATNPDLPGDVRTRLHRHDLPPYFGALEMLRGHLYRCLTQVAIVANTKIPKIADHLRYEDAWQLAVYKQPQLMNNKNRQPTDSGSAMERG
jgi:hypothetical protein